MRVRPVTLALPDVLVIDDILTAHDAARRPVRSWPKWTAPPYILHKQWVTPHRDAVKAFTVINRKMT